MTAAEQLEILKRGIVEIVPEEELLKKLETSVKENKPLNVKMGIDPTSSDVHLGHTVVMRKLAQFQKLGHKVTLIIGDYTATVGDPTGKSKTRAQLTHEQVLEYAKSYQDQLFKIVDEEKTNVVFNGDWFSKMSFNDIIKLMSKITVAQMLERQDFQNRYKNGQPISLHEFMYPMMQGWDSVEIQSDVELGGTDQKFNVLRGRELQVAEEMEPQVGLFLPILLGTCGREKMSKSLGNYIGINETAESMYHKVYNIPDSLIVNWFELLTDVPMDEVNGFDGKMSSGEVNPKDLKVRLALDIVSQYHGAEAAQQAKEKEAQVHSGQSIPDDAPEFTIPEGEYKLLEILKEIKAFNSNGEARKMVQNGGVKLDGEKAMDPQNLVQLKGDAKLVIQVGKRKFFKVNF